MSSSPRFRSAIPNGALNLNLNLTLTVPSEWGTFGMAGLHHHQTNSKAMNSQIETRYGNLMQLAASVYILQT